FNVVAGLWVSRLNRRVDEFDSNGAIVHGLAMRSSFSRIRQLNDVALAVLGHRVYAEVRDEKGVPLLSDAEGHILRPRSLVEQDLRRHTFFANPSTAFPLCQSRLRRSLPVLQDSAGEKK